ncbi:hypothetical protein [Salibacterium aidingense]|uniref:hypothetical protein n=1 Tax=Salibacterium aidingense TaxID=384933 RepID=UPI003BE68A41
MKAVVITIMVCYIFIFWIGLPIRSVLFSGDGGQQPPLQPIYTGVVLLSGLIVGGTVYIIKTIKNTKSNHRKKENSK